MLVGDTLVGNIVKLYLAYSTPDLFVGALERLQTKARPRVISSHGDVRSPAAISNAQFYLESLRDRTDEARASAAGEQSLLQAQLETCLPAGVRATPFEKIFHDGNVHTILKQNFFA